MPSESRLMLVRAHSLPKWPPCRTVRTARHSQFCAIFTSLTQIFDTLSTVCLGIVFGVLSRDLCAKRVTIRYLMGILKVDAEDASCPLKSHLRVSITP